MSISLYNLVFGLGCNIIQFLVLVGLELCSLDSGIGQ